MNNIFPNKELMDKIRSHPLYQEAFQCFKNGDQQKGMELLNQMQKTECMDDIKKHMDDNNKPIDDFLKSSGVIMIGKDEPIPDGYSRNTFSDKTNITTQGKNPEEWKDIIANITYKGDIVYEDHCSVNFLTMNMLYGFKKDNPDLFCGHIISNSNINHTLAKFQKNSLYLIMDKLNIELVDVNYSVIEILESLLKCEHLKDIIIVHHTRKYDDEEIKNIKKLFVKTKWHSINLKALEKCLNLSK